MRSLACPACGETTCARTYPIHDDRFGFPGSFAYRECAGCGHVWDPSPLPDKELASLYTDYYPRAGFDVDAHRPFREEGGVRGWLNGAGRSAYRHVPRGVSVLDIGCGSCEALGYHLGRGCTAEGVEADGNVRRIAERFGYRVRIGHFSDIDFDRRFQFITLDQVIEHMTDPLQSLRRVADLLEKGGSAIVSTPNSAGWGVSVFGKYWLHWHAPYHRHVFSRRSLAMVAGRSGLVTDSIRTVTPSEWLHFQLCHLATYPEAGRPSPFWTAHRAGSLTGKILLKAAGLCHLLRVTHLATRLFDLAGRGDNLLIVLRKP